MRKIKETVYPCCLNEVIIDRRSSGVNSKKLSGISSVEFCDVEDFFVRSYAMTCRSCSFKDSLI